MDQEKTKEKKLMENDETKDEETPEWVRAIRYIQEQLPADTDLIPSRPEKMTMSGAEWLVERVKNNLEKKEEEK
ncbi:hypothetical protein KJ969_01555 [Patescibacteria group bacterium]|nr:hypothetical protein [Patescibacteria group bacterium]MBU1922142.1 hypothetical protein [Patescibacteria group bacterium]